MTEREVEERVRLLKIQGCKLIMDELFQELEEVQSAVQSLRAKIDAITLPVE